ncbi:hypothetical protein [Novosphingobium sp. PhB165]|uniref:hypothetical protein n=1 Tax=Novosphingobium sp. PhB165 TaxID=2485105 RepID=UPI00104BE286|nr:hypothetical protein [Novosphingobium sp. PhB165]
MKIYTLKFLDDGNGGARRLDFGASDLAEALIVAHRKAAKCTAELWQGARKLCTIRREGAGGPMQSARFLSAY